ncbi:MAG: acetyl esterase [Cellulomonas sp.]
MTAPNVLARVTPQMQAVLDKQSELANGAFATSDCLEEMRRNYVQERSFWNEGGPVMAETVDDVVPGPFGDIHIRAFLPSTTSGRPGIVYIHGGGFVVGNLDTHDRIMRALAQLTGSVVVGVEYALSPEAKFPVAVRECAAVIHHLRAEGAALGIDGDHLALAGDSGGANLCLAATLYLRDEAPEDPALDCLILFYGQFGLQDSASQRLFGGEWDGLSRADLAYYARTYTTGPQDLTSPYYDCLSADLSRGVPPCYVAASGLDPLRDDSLALAALLEGAGVPHRLRVFDGVLHGFLHYSRMLPEAGEALADGATFYRSTLTAIAP